MFNKILLKKIGLIVTIIFVLGSFVLNGITLYQKYCQSIFVAGQQNGQQIVMRFIDENLKKEGKVAFNRNLEDGKVETIILIPAPHQVSNGE